MPNWVMNSVYITGEPEKVLQLETKLAAPYKDIDGGAVNFLNLIAPPDEKWDSYNCGNITFGSDKEEDPYNWYSWNINHWGTKWNACNAHTDKQIGNDGLLQLGLKFDTAWAAPEGIVNALWTLCSADGLSLDWRWEEEQGFGEEWETVDNEFVLTHSWDIPSSHAEYVERGQDEFCPCQWADSKFDDCPEVAESVST